MLRIQRRTFFSQFTKNGTRASQVPSTALRLDTRQYDRAKVDAPTDDIKKVFGVRVSDLKKYGRINFAILAVCGCVYVYVYGYMYVASFSIMSALRIGWFIGIATCASLALVAMWLRKIVRIPTRAVYNQSFSVVTSKPAIKAFIGDNPLPLHDFFAVCRRGGIRRPTLKRLQSWEYGLDDILGRKPKKLHMTYILGSSEKGKEGRTVLVSCEVVSEGDVAWWKRRSYAFSSIAVSMAESDGRTHKSECLVGGTRDIVVGTFPAFNDSK